VITVPDDNAEIGPVPVSGGGGKAEPEMDRLSNILKSFSEHFGTLFADSDRVLRRIQDDIAPKVAADPAYQNARKNTPKSGAASGSTAVSEIIGQELVLAGRAPGHPKPAGGEVRNEGEEGDAFAATHVLMHADAACLAGEVADLHGGYILTRQRLRPSPQLPPGVVGARIALCLRRLAEAAETGTVEGVGVH
jgi:hypothetical protein